MSAELQRLVESLGGRLRRSVAVDDPHLRLLAYNSHASDVDDARINSILSRGAPSELVAYVDGLGARKAEGLLAVPPQPALGLTLNRACMPIRHGDVLLGYLWLLLSEGPVPPAQLELVRQAADTAAALLHRDHLLGQLARGRERELARDLLDPDPHIRAAAHIQLIEEDLLVAGPVAALVVVPAGANGEPVAERDRLGIALALDHGRKQVPPRHAIQLERPDHGVLVLAQPDPLRGADGQDARCGVAAVADAVATAADGPHERWVGIGRPRQSAVEVRDSYLEAQRAATVARVTGVLGRVVPHAQLGVYGLLAELPAESLQQGLHPGLRALLEAGPPGSVLLDTIEAYLDNAGDVQRTSAQLCIHRATLYYRLRRIEERVNVDLACGDDRLVLHLGLKVARLLRPL